jgi:16S rRNA (guanine527-N7)-methyltransferase
MLLQQKPTFQEYSSMTLIKRLGQALDDLGLDMDPSKQTALIEYLLELEKWNRTYNLTAIKTVDEMLVQHVFDCLALIPALERHEKQHNFRFDLVADIGSGAGLPAVVLAISRPQTRVISIDAVQKKTSFVQNVANRLGLVNLEARHGRVEQIRDIKADLVISRAFASLQNFVELAQGLATKDGVIAAMKSKQLEAELQEICKNQSKWHVHQVDELSVPEMQATRCVAWLRRKNNE